MLINFERTLASHLYKDDLEWSDFSSLFPILKPEIVRLRGKIANGADGAGHPLIVRSVWETVEAQILNTISHLRRATDKIGSYCLEIELRKIQAISDEVRAVIVKIIMLSHLGFHCFFVHVVGKTKPAKNTPKYFLALLPCSNQSPIASRLRAHLRDWALVRVTVGRKSARVFVLWVARS